MAGALPEGADPLFGPPPDGDDDNPPPPRPYPDLPDPGSFHDLQRDQYVPEVPDLDIPSPPDSPRPPHMPDLPQDRPHISSIDDLPKPQLEHLQTAMDFIHALRNASFENSTMTEEILEHIAQPLSSIPDVDNRWVRLSLDTFITVQHASRESYDHQIARMKVAFPEAAPYLLSYDQVQRRLTTWTGIYLQEHDMCIKDCVAYTAHYADLDFCPAPGCGEPRYTLDGRGKPLARKKWWSLPLAPQIQARWASPARAKLMKHGWERMKSNVDMLHRTGKTTMESLSDVFDGSDFLNRFIDPDDPEGSRFNVHDTFILFSCDGAQIYESKESDCWFSIALIMNLPPNLRYKNTELLPLSIIPGKPKNMDSFNFPVFHEMCCLMNEGMSVYDAEDGQTYELELYLPFACADGPAMVGLDGGVGHSGAHGCRLHCPCPFRHKDGGSHYYPASQCPTDFHVAGSDFADVDLADVAEWEPDDQVYLQDVAELLAARNNNDYARLRLKTGLTKPSLFLGFPPSHIFGVPGTFALDLFHLPALNVPDLLFSLWRGTLTCDTKRGDSKDSWAGRCFKLPADWLRWGSQIGSLLSYIPIWFGRAPRNPAKKMSSGYKGEEYENLLFGLGPQELQPEMPEDEWEMVCMLIQGFELLAQEDISDSDLLESQRLFSQFVDLYETKFVQRKESRLHFVRPWLHTIIHIPNHTVRKGLGLGG
jgi:hypothetical protein